MSQPDYIMNLTNELNGPQAWIWIDRIMIDRYGDVSLSGIPQVEDKWRIELHIKASLAINNAIVYDKEGKEITVSCPIKNIVEYNVASFANNPDVITCISSLRDVCIGIINGTITETN
jgi:hypothetical protein